MPRPDPSRPTPQMPRPLNATPKRSVLQLACDIEKVTKDEDDEYAAAALKLVLQGLNPQGIQR